MTPKEFAKIVEIDQSTVLRKIKAGKILATPVPSRGRGGMSWDIPKEEAQKILGEDAKKEILARVEQEEKSERRKCSAADLDALIEQLGLSKEEGARLRVTLSSFPKAQAEAVLKAEQALAKQRENILARGEYVERKVVAQQIEFVMSELSRYLSDQIDIWETRYSFGPSVSRVMRNDYDALVRRFVKQLETIVNGPG